MGSSDVIQWMMGAGVQEGEVLTVSLSLSFLFSFDIFLGSHTNAIMLLLFLGPHASDYTLTATRYSRGVVQHLRYTASSD